jgi:ABC-2 type transport system permease protein
MFMTVMISAQPMLGSVLEEKQQRIAEVLLGSARPFDLMLGKLVGNVGVAMTIVAVYFTGGYILANQYGFAHMIPTHLVGWFIVYQILAVLLFGSVFTAIGAACTELKEAQSLLMPVMVLLVLPMMVWFTVLEDPMGKVATWLSLFPPSAPMLMLLRQSVSSAVPVWQPVLAVVLISATTVLCIFAAGRVFRIGILSQGKAPKLTELAGWIIRG